MPSSRRVDSALAVLGGLAAVLGRADLWLVLNVVLLSRCLAGSRRSVLASLPPAALLTGAGLVAVLTAAGLADLAVLASATQTRLLLVVLSLATAPLVLRRRRQRPTAAGRDERIACVPAAVVLALGLVLSRLSLPDAVASFLVGWDNSAHALYSAEIARSGELSYEERSYPRGLHAIVALTLTARGPVAMRPESLEDLLRAQSLTVWVLFSLLTCAVALTTLRLAALRGAPGPLATVTATAAGLATLSPFFFGFTMQFGFETTIAAALVLAVVSLELLQKDRQPLLVLVLASAVALMAHTYQLLLPVVGLPLAVQGIALLRRRPLGWALTTAVSAALLLTAVPPVWSVVTRTGVGAVAIPGAAAGLPVFWLVAGVLTTLWLAAGRVQQVQLLAGMVLLLLATAVGSAWLGGASLVSYYPRKMLWHAALLALPVLAVAVSTVLRSFTRRTSRIPGVRILGGATGGFLLVVLVVLAVPGPYMAFTGGWHVRGDVVGALMHPEDERRVCSMDSEFARQVTHRMQSFYGGPEPSLGALPPCPRAPSEP